MTVMAPNGSIHVLPAERPGLLIFEIVALITDADMGWMASRVQAAFDQQDEIDMLIVMRFYDGMETGAVINSEAMKAGARSLRHVRRYAVVGAPTWATAMINILSPLTPVEEKTFPLEREAEARAWVGAPPKGGVM